MTDVETPVATCPACGEVLQLVDGGGDPDGPRWPPHGRSDSVHGCEASYTPLALARPRTSTAAQAWPSSPMRLALAAARAYYRRPGCCTGGRLHVVLDDGNVEAAIVEHCRDSAMAINDPCGVELAHQLMRLTESQRTWVAHHIYGNEFPELGPSAAVDRWALDDIADPGIRAAVGRFMALADPAEVPA